MCVVASFSRAVWSIGSVYLPVWLSTHLPLYCMHISYIYIYICIYTYTYLCVHVCQLFLDDPPVWFAWFATVPGSKVELRPQDWTHGACHALSRHHKVSLNHQHVQHRLRVPTKSKWASAQPWSKLLINSLRGEVLPWPRCW